VVPSPNETIVQKQAQIARREPQHIQKPQLHFAITKQVNGDLNPAGAQIGSAVAKNAGVLANPVAKVQCTMETKNEMNWRTMLSHHLNLWRGCKKKKMTGATADERGGRALRGQEDWRRGEVAKVKRTGDEHANTRPAQACIWRYDRPWLPFFLKGMSPGLTEVGKHRQFAQKKYTDPDAVFTTPSDL
jgi:hypothetical protein